jgi:hypothetical protein
MLKYRIKLKIWGVSLVLLTMFCYCSDQNNSNELFKLKKLQSRSASYENPDADKGKGGMTANGIKGSPAIKDFKKGTTEILLIKAGSGVIHHIWCTFIPADPEILRNIILRMYWENSSIPSVEVPISDFFGIAHGATAMLNSDLIVVEPSRGYNCFFPMPFAKNALITVTNDSDTDLDWFFYQIDFTLGDNISNKDGRFHAAFHRENPTKLGKDFVILETTNAPGVYVGCVLGVRGLTPGWYGEGEVKMYIDEDENFPTICGTGLEDYIGAAWGISREFCTFTQGAPLVDNRNRFVSFYRFHINDPVYFQNGIKVTVQQMGNSLKSKEEVRYGDKLIFSYKNHPRRDPDDIFYLRSDDVCATAFWYQYPLISQREKLPDKAVRTNDLYKINKNSESGENL